VRRMPNPAAVAVWKCNGHFSSGVGGLTGLRLGTLSQTKVRTVVVHERDQSLVAEVLESLPDLVTNMFIGRVKLRKFCLQFVNLGQRKTLANPPAGRYQVRQFSFPSHMTRPLDTARGRASDRPFTCVAELFSNETLNFATSRLS
jgi:hypothetical protein